MQGHRIGYVRVSSFDQNPERQLEQTQVSKVFTDKASGKDTQRPQLEALLSFVREGDTVVVHSMDRLARNLDDLRRLVQKLTQRGVRIEFLKEGGTVAKLAMRQPFVLFKGLTFQKLCLPGAFRPGDHH
ncbi:recombinase family protein, partial [Klebsiella pneumoniae]